MNGSNESPFIIDWLDYINIDKPDLWNVIDDESIYILVFEDGSGLKCLGCEMLWNWYYWKMFYYFPVVVPPGESLFWRDAQMKTGTQVAVASKIIQHILAYGERRYDPHDEVARRYMIQTNYINDAVCIHLGSEINTVDLLHYMHLNEHPAIQEARHHYLNYPTPEEPELDEKKVYKALDDLIESDPPELHNNEIALGILSGTLPRRSAHQTAAPRGFVESVDGSTFVIPITSSYTDGLGTAYDMFIEADSSKRAMIAQGAPLEEAEYFNRQCQMATAVMRQITPGDCGSTNYLDWVIGPKDLDIFHGSMFMNHETGTLERFDKSFTHYIGEQVSFRSSLTCMNHHTDTICRVCAGDAADYIPREANPGLYLITEPNGSVVQANLGTKHLEVSRLPLILSIDERNKNFFMLDRRDRWALQLKPIQGNLKPYLRIPKSHAAWLSKLETLDDLERVNPRFFTRVYNLNLVLVNPETNKALMDFNQTVSIKDSHAVFTMNFLEYIFNKGYEVDEEDIIIDMTDWNNTLPLLLLPRVNTNIRQFLASIRAYLFGSQKATDEDNEVRSREESVMDRTIVDSINRVDALKTFMDIICPPSAAPGSPSVNVSRLQAEMYVRACMAVDPANHDYRIPRGDEDFSFINFRGAIMNRGSGSMIGYQEHYEVLTNPALLLNRTRHASIHDVMVIPEK